MLKRLWDWLTRPSLNEYEGLERMLDRLQDDAARLICEKGDLIKERDGLLRRAAESHCERASLHAEIERLKKELEEAERDETHAFGVMDSIDTTVANALESLGLDQCVGQGFPWRVDKLIEAAKERNEYMARLHTSQAECERLRQIIEDRDEDVANALSKIRRSSPPPKGFEERVDRLVDTVKEAWKLKADAVKYANMIAAASHNIIAVLKSKG